MTQNNTLYKEGDTGYRELGLYIHIPFCVRKCNYCDFLSAPASKDTIDRYFDAMLTEIGQYQGRTDAYIVPTIFFGGGTPSLVEPVYIEKVMKALNEIFRIDSQNLEATIEVNPGTVTPDKLQIYKDIGINRLSFGLQSADNKELSLLGRIHTYEQFTENYYLARKMGYRNINIDLMSALPGQNVQNWENTLTKVIQLNPEHISAYSLIIEKGTKFYEQYNENAAGFAQLPDEETDRLIYHRTKEMLQNSGYHRYEISNYARKGFECRHNSSYWIGTDYLGIGLGASSLLHDARFSNVHDIALYMKMCATYNDSHKKAIKVELSTAKKNREMDDSIGLRVNTQYLSQKQKMEEFMFLGLRMCDGISRNAFFQRFGVAIDQIYGNALKHLEENKLLIMEDDNIRLTEYGTDISNYVFTEFLLD